MSIRLSEPENLNDKKMLKHKKGIKKTRKNLLLITTTTTTITTTTAATTSTTITTVTCNKDLKEHRNLVDAISQDATLFLRRASLFLRLPAQGEADTVQVWVRSRVIPLTFLEDEPSSHAERSRANGQRRRR